MCRICVWTLRELAGAFNSVHTSLLCSSWQAALQFSAELTCSNRVLKASLKFLMKFIKGSGFFFFNVNFTEQLEVLYVCSVGEKTKRGNYFCSPKSQVCPEEPMNRFCAQPLIRWRYSALLRVIQDLGNTHAIWARSISALLLVITHTPNAAWCV